MQICTIKPYKFSTFADLKVVFCEFYVFPISPRPIHMGRKYDYVERIPNPDFLPFHVKILHSVEYVPSTVTGCKYF
jgi:hypothetical protein